MEPISVECPNCGASLPPTEPGGEYRCSYCRSSFRLEQAKQAKTSAGVPIDPHALAAAILAAQGQVQAQQHAGAQQPAGAQPSTGTGALGCAIAIATLLIVAGVAVAVVLGLRGSTDTVFGNLRPSEHLIWDSVGGIPQLVRVNGEPAIVGRTRALAQADHLYCGVHAITGAPIWRTESLGTYMGGYQSTFCGAVGDALIVTNSAAQLQIFALATGERRELIELSDVVDYLCVAQDPAESSEVWIKQLDQRTHLLDPSTGELREAPQPSWCFDSRHTAQRRLQGGGSWADADADAAPQVEGLELEFVYTRAGEGVALGHTAPGTPVPTAVGFDPASKAIKWQQGTPSVAKATLRQDDKFGAIAGGLFVTTYGAGQDAWYITGLDLETGQRVWETKLRPILGVDRLGALVANDSHAVLVRTSSLEIFESATGELVGTIGRESYQ